MYRLKTTTDIIIYIVVSLALGTLGALMLLFPIERLPEDRASYRAEGGVLREIKDESIRRGTTVVFALEGNKTKFVSSSPPSREEAKTWVVGQTTLQFFILNKTEVNTKTVSVYGIKTQSHQVRSLKQDIDYHNASINPWSGLMALTIGILGMVVAACRWRHKSKV